MKSNFFILDLLFISENSRKLCYNFISYEKRLKIKNIKSNVYVYMKL